LKQEEKERWDKNELNHARAAYVENPFPISHAIMIASALFLEKQDWIDPNKNRSRQNI
jgi:hypothetical protein